MARVVKNGFFSLGAVDRSSDCEGFEPSWEMEVLESRPFNQAFVAKDGGLENHSFSVNFLEDSGMALAQYLNANAGTKVAFVLRYSDAVISATNPEWTGSCIVPPAAPPGNQGEIMRFSVTFEVDGQAAMATA